MSDWITLTLRAAPNARIRVHGLHPNRLADLSAQQVADLRVSVGREAAHVGDFFTISGERASRVRVEGSSALVDGLGAGMLGGELVIEGDAGSSVGGGMAGGTLHVRGSVGDDAGLRMSGGVLRIDGSAGDRLGGALAGASKGMTGGEIIVLGSAGAEAAMRARRGLVVVAGDVGGEAARDIIAGSLVVLGSCGPSPGRGSKRGSIVVSGRATIPATYHYACTFEPPHVRVTMMYLRRRYELAIPDTVVNGQYRRYCGDAGDPGKGEILHRAGTRFVGS